MSSWLRDNAGSVRLVLLGVGAAVGLLLAARELVGRPSMQASGLPADIVARVGSRDISMDRYRLVLGDLDADRRAPLTKEDRDFALQRLVDEELLVLQGIQMGLVESLPEVRKAVVRAVIAQTVAEAEAVVPSEKQLLDLYQSDPGFFTSAAQYRVIWLRGPQPSDSGATNAGEARSLLQSGNAPERVAAMTGLEQVTELPDGLMPLTKLRDYLGPELAQAVQELSAGAAAGPLVADGQVHILYLVEKSEARLPAFAAMRPVIEAEYTRRQGEAALQSQLQRLRRETEITVDSDKLTWP